MELVLVAIALVVGAAFVLRDAYSPARKEGSDSSPIEALPAEQTRALALVLQPIVAPLVGARSITAPVAPAPQIDRTLTPDILPGTGAEPDRETGPGDIVPAIDDEEEFLVPEPLSLESVGIPIVRPDPDRFFQTEILEPMSSARTIAATARLLVVVTCCGVGVGVLFVLFARVLGLLIRRVAGA